MKIPVNKFKKALLAGQQQYGYWLGLCNPLSAELCAHTGYDWLLIDGEHAPNNVPSVLAQLQAIEGTPSSAMVRLVNDDTALIKQHLDIGAQSLLIPMVETAQQAEQIALAVQYPPLGTRGVGAAIARAASWNMVDDYLNDVDEQICLIIQVESVTALENLDAILAVDRIDAVFIGPADLAATMGHLGNPAHPEVFAAIKTAVEKIKAAGKVAGGLAVKKDTAKSYEAAGMQFLAIGVDALTLANGAKDLLSDYKGENSSAKLAY